jgi:hypothetical protein
MTANLPPTLDGLLFSADLKGRELLKALYMLEDHADSRMVFANGESKASMEELSTRVWQAIGLVEGACHMLDLAKDMRPRCLT